jgi:hypothetical protein
MSTHDTDSDSAAYRQSNLSGELIGNPTEYNQTRHEGDVSTEPVSVSTMLNRLDSPQRDNHTDTENAVEKVRAWCVRRRLPMSKFQVYEHAEYGTVQIGKTGYVDDDEWNRIQSLFRETDGIGFDGDVNFCDPDWVSELPAGDLTVRQKPESKTESGVPASPSYEDGDRFPCPVSSCGSAFGDVDALAGHIGGKAPYDEAHDNFGEIVRDELLDLEVRA